MARVRDLWRQPSRSGHGKRWLAVWIGPDDREHSKAFVSQQAAKRYGQAQETDAARGTYIDPKLSRVTVEAWAATWLAGYGTRRASTVRQARSHLKLINAAFGPVPIGQVRPSQVKSWTAQLRAEGYAVSTVHALHRRLAQVMAAAVDDGLLARSPCGRGTSPGMGSQRPYVATTAQVWALADAMGELRPAVLLGAFAGLRLSEACGLRVGDVDFMRGVITPAVQWPGAELKTETARTPIPIPPSMALELSAAVAPSGSNNVTPSGSNNVTLLGVSPWQLDRAYRAARVKVDGLPEGFRYHDLRHYFASLLIASGCDVKVVQARLRHASAKTTLDVYGHMFPGRDESTRAAVEAVFTAQSEQSRNRQAGS